MQTASLRNCLFLSILFTFGCKPVGQSSLQSVDAITSGDSSKLEEEICGKVNDEGNAKSSEEKAINRIFAALPPTIQSFYGGQANALKTVELVDDLKGECTKALSNHQNKEVLLARAIKIGTCTKVAEIIIDGNIEKRPVLVMKKDVKQINGSLLSNYVFVYLGVLIDGTLTRSEADADMKDLSRFFNDVRSRLAKSVIADLSGVKNDSGQPVSEVFRSEFGSNLEQSSVFQNFLVSEFAESYYCSMRTYDHFKNSSFKESKKQWSADTLESLQSIFTTLGRQNF